MKKTLSLPKLQAGTSEPYSPLGLSTGTLSLFLFQSFLNLHSPVLAKILLSQFRETPQSLIFDHPGLASARISPSLMSSLSNFPSFNPPNPLLAYESPLVLVVLGTEPSSILRSLFLCCNSSWMKSVFTSLTSVWFWFSLTNVRLWLNHHSGLVTTELASNPLCCVVSTLYLNNFSNTHNCHLYTVKNFKGFPHRLFYFFLTTALVKQGRVLSMRKQNQSSCSSCRGSPNKQD